MRVLSIEPEKTQAAQLKGILQSMFVVDVVHSGKEGLFAILSREYDLCILGTQLPDESEGLELCRELRRQRRTIPILVLSNRSSVENKVVFLNAGADDYVVKPYSHSELIARVKALLRRPTTSRLVILKHKGLELHTITNLAFFHGKPLALTRKEFLLLQYLVRHPGQIINRLQLAEHVWEKDIQALMSNTVDVHIGALRKKIGRSKSVELIRTVHGNGYILI